MLLDAKVDAGLALGESCYFTSEIFHDLDEYYTQSVKTAFNIRNFEITIHK